MVKRSLSVLVIAKAIESLLARLVGVLVFLWVFEIGGGGTREGNTCCELLL